MQLSLRDPAGNGIKLNLYGSLPTSPVDELRRLDQEGAAAVLASDAATLDRLYAAQHLLHYAPAKLVRSREQVLDDVRQQRFRYSSFSRVVEHVSHHGEIGITIGVERAVTESHPIHGGGRALERRYTHVWCIEDGRWRLLVRHASDTGAE